MKEIDPFFLLIRYPSRVAKIRIFCCNFKNVGARQTLSRKDGSRNQRNFCHDNETRIVNGAAPRSGTHTGFKLAGFIAVVCLSVNGGDRFSKPIELGKKARLMADRYQRYSMFRCPRSEIA